MTLRTRLVALAVGSVLAALLLLAVPVAVVVHDAVEDEREREAAVLAEGVADLLSTGTSSTDDLSAVLDRGRGRRGGSADVGVLLADGTALGEVPAGCGDAPAERPRGRGDDLLAVSDTATTSVYGGAVVAVRVQSDDGEAVVCAVVDDADVREEVAERLAPLALGGGVVMLVVAGVALLLARRVAGHLEAAAATADRLSTGDLDARVDPAGPPEVRSVAIALNRLAQRIDELLTLERETVADLSHRLRTPLTAIRLDVEALPASPAQVELDEHVTTLERTLTAVIQAARRPQREGAVAACDPVSVVRERFAFWSPLLEDQGREVSLVVDAPPGVQVRCAAADLTAALDALLENAVAHTDEGVAVGVELRAPDDEPATVEVRDRGPGVPPQALARGRSDRGSTGLGLDIARGCAEGSGGRLELDRDDAWSVVRLVLGR